MNADLFQLIEAQGGCVQLARACFRLTGTDRVRYLNGQVTNDVRRANEHEAVYACVTDLKGRIVGDVFIHSQGDALFLDTESELREVLGPRLERYIIADDVELTDVTDDWQLWHVFGKAAETWDVVARSLQGAVLLKSDRLGLTGLDLWLPAGPAATPAPIPELFASSLRLCPEDFEVYRILRGIPRYPHELNGEAFPPEAGLDDRAMSYTKGCYIGQEILSRIRTTGKMPRSLLRWQAQGEVARDEELQVGGKGVGKITSVTAHPVTQQSIGLAYVRQGCTGPCLTASGVQLQAIA